MKWTLYHRWMWFWCWLCYRAYMALPPPGNHQTRYGRFSLWLLGYAGAYAHSTHDDFHWCVFFFASAAACRDAWEKHQASTVSSTDGK